MPEILRDAAPGSARGGLVHRMVGRLIRGRPLLARLLGNSVWQVADKLSRMGAGVVVTAYVARYLGPADYGLISFGLALVALFSAIATCGLPSVVVRDLIVRPAERPTILASALLLRLVAGVVALLLDVGAAFLLGAGKRQEVLVIFIIACSVIPQAWDIIDYDYQSRIDARPVVIARNVSFFLSSGLRIVLVLLRAPVTGFAAALCAEQALAALLLARRWRQDRLSVGMGAAQGIEMRHLAALSWPLIVAGLSVSLYMRVDQVMLEQMMGNAGVGLFSAAVRVSEALYFLPVAVATTVAPALTELRRRSAAEYERRFVTITRLMVWLALAVAITFAVFSRPIILLLYGPRYAAAATVLSIHTWAGVLVSLGVCSSLWLTNEGYFKYSMYQTLAGAVVNVALNLTLIPRYGIVGAAVASCAGQFASVLLTNGVLPRTRRLFRLQLTSLVPVLRVARAR